MKENIGLHFYAAFPPGFMLGGALAFGLLLVNAICLLPPEYHPGAERTRPLLRTVALGAFCFAAMHLFHIFLFNPGSFIGKPLVPLLGLVAGAGLSLAVYDQPVAGWRIGASRWLLRLATVALVFALIQAAFVAVDLALGSGNDLGTGLVIAWSGYFYRSRLHDPLIDWGLGGITTVENWYHYAAIGDAALTGIALSVSLTVGLNLAQKQYQRWATLVRRGGED